MYELYGYDGAINQFKMYALKFEKHQRHIIDWSIPFISHLRAKEASRKIGNVVYELVKKDPYILYREIDQDDNYGGNDANNVNHKFFDEMKKGHGCIWTAKELHFWHAAKLVENTNEYVKSYLRKNRKLIIQIGEKSAGSGDDYHWDVLEAIELDFIISKNVIKQAIHEMDRACKEDAKIYPALIPDLFIGDFDSIDFNIDDVKTIKTISDNIISKMERLFDHCLLSPMYSQHLVELVGLGVMHSKTTPNDANDKCGKLFNEFGYHDAMEFCIQHVSSAVGTFLRNACSKFTADIDKINTIGSYAENILSDTTTEIFNKIKKMSVN